MICKNCGKENPEDIFVCEKCNKPLDIIIENEKKISMKEKFKNSIEKPRFFKFDIFVIPVITVILLFILCSFIGGLIEKNTNKDSPSYTIPIGETEFFELYQDGEEYTGTDDGVYSETDIYITNAKSKIPKEFELIGQCLPDKVFMTKYSPEKTTLMITIDNKQYGVKINKAYELLKNFSGYNVYLYGSSQVKIGNYWYLTDACFLLEPVDANSEVK